MSKWREVKLGKIVSFTTGKLNSNAAVEGGKYPFYTCSQTIFKTNTFSFDTECIILGGNNANAKYPLFYKKGKFDAYQRNYIIEPKDKNELNIKFLYYYMRLRLEYMRVASTGVTTKFLTLKILKNMRFQIPDLVTQEKIADVLSTYDELIENNNRRIEILEKTAEEIYKEWFVRMRFPGYENTKFIQGIPEEWEVRKFINKEVKLISSGINKFEGLKRYMATADVEGISLKHGEDITFTERPSRANMQPKENTIWFAKMQDTIKHLYFRNHSQKLIENIILSTGFAGIEFKNINHYYYYLSFIRYGIFEDIKDMYANGSTQVAINNQNIKRIRLLMPDKELLNAFNNIVELNFEMIEKYKEQNQKLIKQRDLLLPRLMNGTIEVK